MQSSIDLSLKKVVLFKVGIGSFQKQGTIDLAQTTQLRLSFKDTVMNDLLKTFSILRVNGDLLISGVSYEAKDTNKAKLLEESLINLPEQNSFSALIKQLRGFPIQITLAGKKFIGKVLGTQKTKTAPTGQAIIETDNLILAFESGEIKPIPIAEIEGLEITDSTVDKDLKYFLETIVGQNKEKNKTVTIFFEGKQKSEFILNFLQETPAWKTTYRVYLEEEAIKVEKEGKEREIKASKKSPTKKEEKINDKKKIALQGWAIVDNPLDEDWENVDLTLVTGLPVTFIYDSYSPQWIIRPTVARKVETGVKPVQFEREMFAKEKKMEERSMKKAKPMGGGAPGGPPKPCAAAPCPPPSTTLGSSGFGMAKAMARMDDAENGLISLADSPSEPNMDMAPEPEQAFESTSEAEGGRGMAFKYHIKNPVFVKRNNSSLIPILQSDIESLLVSVYNKNIQEKHPMRTLEFTNDTGLTLEEGPISVFINKTFAGEAMLPFLEQNSKGRIPFSVDQSVEVSDSYDEIVDKTNKIEILDSIYCRYYRTMVKTYKIKNFSNDEAKKLIIEHPKSANYKLYETVDPDEETANFYRFNLVLEPKENKTFVVKERRLDTSVEQSDRVAVDIVESWLSAKLITQKEYDYIIAKINFTNQRDNLENEQNNLTNQKANIIEDQNRLRENLRALKTSSAEKQLREKYIAKLDEGETELERIEKALTDNTKKIQEIEQKVISLNEEWVQFIKAEREKAKETKKESDAKKTKEAKK